MNLMNKIIPSIIDNNIKKISSQLILILKLLLQLIKPINIIKLIINSLL